jgi:hypothetical protein
MEQRPSWEVNSLSVNQQIPYPKVHYQNEPKGDPILSYTNPFHTPTHCFFETQLNISF